MKLNLLSVFLFVFVLTSCSSDDNGGGSTDNGDSIPTTYMPMVNGNYWTYDISNYQTSDPTTVTPARDSIYISNDTLINNVTHKKVKTLNDAANGFFASCLRNNGIKINGSSLVVSGSFNAPFPGLTTPLTINLNQFIFFKENAAQGTELSTSSGSFTQNVSGYDLLFEYTFKSTADGSIANFTSPNGDAYTNVKKSKITLNLKVTNTQTIAGIPITVTILQPQNVIVSTQYYVSNRGMVYDDMLFSYNLSTLPAGLSLPIPSSMSLTQKEYLDTFVVN
jgi:hypothetical protein